MHKPASKQIWNKYQKQYSQKVREQHKIDELLEEQTSIDFNGEYCADVKILQDHCPSDVTVQRYTEKKDDVLKARKICKSSVSPNSSSVAYKAALYELFVTAIVEANLTAESLASCGGSKKPLNKMYKKSWEIAARSLAHKVYLHRQMTTNKLKYRSYDLKDLATRILATMKLTVTEEQCRLALLGLHCHHRLV